MRADEPADEFGFFWLAANNPPRMSVKMTKHLRIKVPLRGLDAGGSPNGEKQHH
jgi:hypothetical protein